jgi:hypothetical protein
MGKNTMVIVHFNPIEQYPLLMNLLDYLGEKMPYLEVYVFTNSTNNSQRLYNNLQKNIRIERLELNDQGYSIIRRYRNYFRFYYKTFQRLKKLTPEWVWYFETISALPVRWYFVKSKSIDSKLIIHYHEYMSPTEYQNGPFLIKWAHQKEKELYEIVCSLSHTNFKRMEMFLRDNQLSLIGKTQILPNYPPRNWVNNIQKNRKSDFPLKIVYMGVVGLESLYIREFSQWVESLAGKVIFDIYSQQNTNELQKWISDKGFKFTVIRGYVPYNELPGILESYHVGVILYKGHIPNYIYNAPNKLFEYWACGLDIWFPSKMDGSLSYARKNCYPKILPLDFEKLEQFDLESAIDHIGLSYQACPYNYEQALDEYFQFVGTHENLN